MARSPASAIAVMRELDAKGRFSTVVLTVAIIIDIVVIVLFSVACEFGSSVHDGQTFNPLMSVMVRAPSAFLSAADGSTSAQQCVVHTSPRPRIPHMGCSPPTCVCPSSASQGDRCATLRGMKKLMNVLYSV